MAGSVTQNHTLRKLDVDDELSLSLLRQPEVLADPYRLYRRMRTNDPVQWDLGMNAWIVTSYADIVTVLRQYLEGSVWTLQQMQAIDARKAPTSGDIILRALLQMPLAEHTRTRVLAAQALTGAGLLQLRLQLQKIADRLIDSVEGSGQMDVVADFAMPLPTIFMAESLHAAIADCERLLKWSNDFALMPDDFHEDPDRAWALIHSFHEVVSYVRMAIQRRSVQSSVGLIHSLLNARMEGRGLTELEVIAEFLGMTMGGYKMAAGLIANTILTLLRNPEHRTTLLRGPYVIPAAIQEILRFESPRQYVVRFAPHDAKLHGKQIRREEPVVAVLGAGNRDPEYFAHPDELDFERANNNHLAFDWAAYARVSAKLVSIQGQVAIETFLRRLSHLNFGDKAPTWHNTNGFRELVSFPITFSALKSRKHA